MEPQVQNGLNRDKKLLERKYITVVLSEQQLEQATPYRCFKCGRIASTIHNEPKAVIHTKIAMTDISGKLVGALCKEDNIMYLFV